jgi:hypothetical protein
VPGCVIPISAAAALAWAKGEIHDREILLRAPLLPEACFILDLPDLSAYHEIVAACVYWRDRGAVCLIARTGTPVVRSHIIRFGGVPLFIDPNPPKTRFFVPPDAFKRWLANK